MHVKTYLQPNLPNSTSVMSQREEVTTRMLTENRRENYNSISSTAVFMFCLP